MIIFIQYYLFFLNQKKLLRNKLYISMREINFSHFWLTFAFLLFKPYSKDIEFLHKQYKWLNICITGINFPNVH